MIHMKPIGTKQINAFDRYEKGAAKPVLLVQVGRAGDERTNTFMNEPMRAQVKRVWSYPANSTN